MIFNKKYELFFLFLLIVPVLLFRIAIESTNYCTPDSICYLEVSENILSGKGVMMNRVMDDNLENEISANKTGKFKKEYFAIWPLGYPACIVVVSYLTALSPLLASKLLNIVLLALDFYLLNLLFSGKFNFPMYYFCSFTMLEICSYTWSENLFIPFFLIFLIAIKKIKNSNTNSLKSLIILVMALVGMFLSRYASIIFYLSTFFSLVYFIRKKDVEKAKILFYGLLISSVFAGLYLYNNFYQTGFITGMPRINTQEYTTIELMQKFFLGVFNQLHIIKQFSISSSSELIFYLCSTIIQLSLMGFIVYSLSKVSTLNSFTERSKGLFFLGIMYLAFLIFVTSFSTIDPFDYRTLLPFSFPVMLAVLTEIEERLILNQKEKTIMLVKVFFIFSLIMNLPKRYLLELNS